MNGPTARPEPVVDQLAEVWASILTACEGLGPATWDEPTDCPGWRVRDNVSHLVGIERMLLGESPPPPLTTFPPHVHNPLGEINEAWVEARRTTSGPEVLREFAEVTDRRLEELRSMPVDHFDVVSQSLLGKMPYRQFIQIRLIDSWAHEQDIRRAVDRPGGRNGTGESVVMDGCARNMDRVVGKSVTPEDGSVVLFNISGLLGRQIAVVMRGGRGTSVDADAAGPPTTTLSMDQEAFWRLCFGRVAPIRLLGTGQVLVDGDVVVGHKVLDAMAFIT
ncbi:MAG: maleylpyruvate isomerase N-terminal domain-containing protein [Acidimicrobiales bacterium]